MDLRGSGIGLALIGVCIAGVWWWAAATCRRRLDTPGALPVLSLCATAAVFLCVPETDHLKGVALLLAGLTLLELAAGEVLPFGWHTLGLTVVLWAGMWGATGRHGAVVGAAFAGWVVVLPAMVATRTDPTTTGRGRQRLGAVCAVAAIAALVVARTGALGSTLWRALSWAGAMAAGSALIAVVLVRCGTRPHPRH